MRVQVPHLTLTEKTNEAWHVDLEMLLEDPEVCLQELRLANLGFKLGVIQASEALQLGVDGSLK